MKSNRDELKKCTFVDVVWNGSSIFDSQLVRSVQSLESTLSSKIISASSVSHHYPISGDSRIHLMNAPHLFTLPDGQELGRSIRL
jgi:hypothetical protein